MLHIAGKFCDGKYSATNIHVLYFHFFYSSAPFILQLATPILWNSVLWTDYPLNIGYHIVGIFRGGKYSFLATSPIFVHFIFIFASSAPFYTTVSHTHFVKFRSLDSFFNEKNEN